MWPIESPVNSGLNYEDLIKTYRVLNKFDDMLEHPKALSTILKKITSIKNNSRLSL